MTPSAAKSILVVDDEVAIRRILRVCLTSAGYAVRGEASGRDALAAIEEAQPDLVLLDLGLPDMDGSKVVARIRESNQCPILILSVRGQESDKVAVLDAGADDYLTKPFGNRELLARIRALLRRSMGQEPAGKLTCGRLTIEQGHHQIRVADQTVHVTPTEYELAKCLVQRQGNVVTHRQLVREVWRGSYNESALHVLHVTVSNLRRKIERDPLQPECILTEPGVGYRIETRL